MAEQHHDVAGNGSGRLDPDELAAMVGHVESNSRWTKKFQRGVRSYVATLPEDYLRQPEDGDRG